MTAYSLRILHFAADASLEALESSALETSLVQSLSLHASECGPYGLQYWAGPRGHPLYYVDNCWVRARVHGKDLPSFFADVLKGGPRLGPAIQPDAEYLIEAEEY
jgi:hypothetical protein